ncbi:MAG TPA: hypothetical protein VFX59_27375 [Polyangiales bacterium]|nr:hypothetical protein [Polyangiales bacterium]
MRALLAVVTALGLVALPFVSERGPRASLFGWLAFAALLSAVRFFAERRRSLGVDAREGDFDGDPASGLHATQQ